jgi:hypothetical protein
MICSARKIFCVTCTYLVIHYINNLKDTLLLVFEEFFLLQNAMAFVFGSTFVCQNMEAAKEVM